MEIALTATASPAAAQPRFSRPRFALLVLAGVYPLITTILYALAPLTEEWLIWQRTLLIAPTMVGAMIWGVIPAVQRGFRGFLNPVSR